MRTVINNPSGGDSGAGIIIGTVVALLVIVLFFIYVFPGMRSDRAPAPAENGGSLDININNALLSNGGTGETGGTE